jgi:adenosylcobyric acid synthase
LIVPSPGGVAGALAASPAGAVAAALAGAQIDIAVIRLPRIANFDDFEPLAREPGVRVRFVRGVGDLGAPDLIVLPGSKSTVADLDWLGARGLADAIGRAAGEGRPVLGVCGGFQMLGISIHDPHGVESRVPTTAGLGLLPANTTFAERKRTVRVRARVLAGAGPFADAGGTEVTAYEIHAGVTEVRPGEPLFEVVERGGEAQAEPDGALNARGNVSGTYLHGIFASAAVRRALLTYLARLRAMVPDARWGTGAGTAEGYDSLADAVARSIDVPAIAKLVGLEISRA